MKINRKKFFIGLIVLLNIFNAVVIYKLWFQPSDNKPTKKAVSVQSKPFNKKQLPIVTTPIDTPQRQYSQAYLPILGSSNRLSSVAMRNLRAYRDKQRKLAINYPGEVYFNGDTTRKEVALTFDDGPDSRVTVQVLKILDQYNVKGNFFFVGNYVKNHPRVVKKIDDEGHLVLNHSNTHQSYMKKTKRWIQQDLLATENAISKVIGKRPALFRPPYGDIDENMIATITASNIKNILWSYDSLDWTGVVKDSIVQGIKDKIRPGEIILMHSRAGVEATVKALPQIIEFLQEQGYKIVKLDKMLKLKAYK